MPRYRSWRAALALLALTASFATTAARAEGTCADAAPGGDWAQYGNDLANTRTQTDSTIDAARAQALEVAWAMPLATAGIGGSINLTPAVAEGCVYAGTSNGTVFAVNAETGALAWKTSLDIVAAGFGGRVVGSPAVSNGHVFFIANEYGNPATGRGPYLAKLDAHTGEVVWTTVLDTLENAYSNGSPIVFDGMVFAGIAGPENSPRARGGFALIDEADGSILAKTYTINDDDFAKGYAGASIWSTPAIDPVAKYAYVGGGNPASKRIEHPFSNALLKIDLDRSRSTFGKIVASYKGNADAYSATLANQPVCETFGEREELQYYGDGTWSLACAQLDLDFGASPNLFTNEDGELLVGALQKSGVYHVAKTGTMTSKFSLPVGAPCFACNIATAATIGDSIFVASNPPGQMVSIDGSLGAPRWVAPIGDGLHGQPVSAANGVVYVMDLLGYFNAFDAATGVQLAKRSLRTDSGGTAATGFTSGGIAIARDKIYAGNAGLLIAYK